MKSAWPRQSTCSSMGLASSQFGPRVLITANRRLVMVLHSREIHVPVGLPVVALVAREGLLPARRILGDARPEITHADRPALERVVAVERPDTLVEAAMHRREQMARPAAVEPVDRPPLRVRIPGAQAHAAIGIARKMDVVLVHVAEAVEDLAHGAGSVELDPGMAIVEPLHEIAMAAFPDAHEEVEVAVGLGS